MNIAFAKPQSHPASVRIVREATQMNAFKQADCAALIWQRDIPGRVKTWLHDRPVAQLPSGRGVVPAHQIASRLRRFFNESALPGGPERAWLEADAFLLADTVLALFSVKFLRIRFDVVTTNACRKFHLDAVKGRLVCTYRGTGTQYGVAKHAEDPAHICTVPTGAPVLLRGSLWPPKPDKGLLHRSPPIEGTGETRLVLVLDPIFDPEGAE